MTTEASIKEKLLRLLEEDRGFRYAVMGLLGFKEILDRITRIEERQQKLEGRFAQLEERFAKLEERQQKLEERFARLEERFAKLEERFARLEERQQRLEERIVKLEERFAELERRQQKLEERQQKLEERLEKLDRTIAVIAHRFGIITEKGFREAMKYVVEEILGVAEVDKWVYKDREGIVYGYPSIVEVDLVVKDNVHVLVEVKSRVSKSDVAELHRIGKLYEKVEGVKPKLLILSGFIDEGAYEAGKRLGVELRPLLESTSFT